MVTFYFATNWACTFDDGNTKIQLNIKVIIFALQQQPTPWPLIAHYTFKEHFILHLVWIFLNQMALYHHCDWYLHKFTLTSKLMCSISYYKLTSLDFKSIPHNFASSFTFLSSAACWLRYISYLCLRGVPCSTHPTSTTGRRVAGGGSVVNGHLFSSSGEV